MVWNQGVPLVWNGSNQHLTAPPQAAPVPTAQLQGTIEIVLSVLLLQRKGCQLGSLCNVWHQLTAGFQLPCLAADSLAILGFQARASRSKQRNGGTLLEPLCSQCFHSAVKAKLGGLRSFPSRLPGLGDSCHQWMIQAAMTVAPWTMPAGDFSSEVPPGPPTRTRSTEAVHHQEAFQQGQRASQPGTLEWIRLVFGLEKLGAMACFPEMES